MKSKRKIYSQYTNFPPSSISRNWHLMSQFLWHWRKFNPFYQFFFILDQANNFLKSEFWKSFLSQPPRKEINWRHLNVNKRGVSVNNSAIVQWHLVNYMYCWSTFGVMVKCCCVNQPWQFYIYWYRCLMNTLQPSTDHRSIFQCNISQ